jgi:hypothetical protein
MAVDVALDTRMDTMRRLVLVDAEATPWLGAGGGAVATLSHPQREQSRRERRHRTGAAALQCIRDLTLCASCETMAAV